MNMRFKIPIVATIFAITQSALAASPSHGAVDTPANKGNEITEPVMIRIPGKNYEMGKYEVTQAEWRSVMGRNPSAFTGCGDSCPVEQVSWNDIQEFLAKLDQKTGKQYRLPTEKEWEYACRGGEGGFLFVPDYCGGDDIESVAWYSGNSGGTTHPVGKKRANGYGLFDMSGNVWEWTQDNYDSEHDWRMLRGGSWSVQASEVRAARRYKFEPEFRFHSIGFRLARTLP